MDSKDTHVLGARVKNVCVGHESMLMLKVQKRSWNESTIVH